MSDDIDKLPGVKERELAKLGPCAVCKKPLLTAEGKGRASLTFYRLTVSRMAWLPDAIQRRVGLQMMVGSPVVAQVMGPDEDLAKVFNGPKEIVLHEHCAMDCQHPLELLREDPE